MSDCAIPSLRQLLFWGPPQRKPACILLALDSWDPRSGRVRLDVRPALRRTFPLLTPFREAKPSSDTRTPFRPMPQKRSAVSRAMLRYCYRHYRLW
jgi:hypothetical protein